MSGICFSSRATGLLAAWRNPYGREEEQLHRFFHQLRVYPLKQVIKTGMAQAGFSVLLVAASIETVAYAILTAFSLPLHGNNKPHFGLELLKSSSFTALWTIFELFRGCYMAVKNDPLINAPTRESFARMQLDSINLIPVCFCSEQDRANIIRYVLPASTEKFINFCTEDIIWSHVKRNTLTLNSVLSILYIDDFDLDDLRMLHITNICRVSSDAILPHWQKTYVNRLAVYFQSIKAVKRLKPNLLQQHLQNVNKICITCPQALKSYFDFIIISFLESRADLGWIENALANIQKECLYPFVDLSDYLQDLNNESLVNAKLNAKTSFIDAQPIVLWLK